LRAKLTNDSNFFVREVGRGSGVLDRSLEIAEVLQEGGRRWCTAIHYWSLQMKQVTLPVMA